MGIWMWQVLNHPNNIDDNVYKTSSIPQTDELPNQVVFSQSADQFYSSVATLTRHDCSKHGFFDW